MKLLLAFALAVLPTTALALDGTWIRTYLGGYGHSVHATPDGGAILGGTFGAGFDCCRPWLVKLAPDGSVSWQRTYDAPGLGGATHVLPTRDGGYVVAGDGITFSALKVDAEGNVLWAKDYGDGGYTFLRVLEADDGSLLLSGATQLQDPSRTNGRAVLVDRDGEVIWQKVYGRPDIAEFLADATLAYNGNFIVAGSARGNYWVMELDRATGDVVWQTQYGGGAEDTGLVVTRILKRNYLVVGASDSFAEGGLRNWWGVILSPSGKVSKQFSLGGPDAEDPHTAIATSDGGFMIGGGTGSFGSGFSDIWLVKFDARARIEWQKTYGMASRTDHAWQILETPTGYAVVGDSYAFPVEYEVSLMNLDREGNADLPGCFTVGDTKVSLRETAAAVREGGATVVDTKIAPVDLEVVETTLDFPIEACMPAGGR